MTLKKYHMRDGWVYDDSNNKASIDRWMTAEDAIGALQTLTRCFDCYDCINCIDCVDCYDCTSCVGCSDCYDCVNCIDRYQWVSSQGR